MTPKISQQPEPPEKPEEEPEEPEPKKETDAPKPPPNIAFHEPPGGG